MQLVHYIAADSVFSVSGSSRSKKHSVSLTRGSVKLFFDHFRFIHTRTTPYLRSSRRERRNKFEKKKLKITEWKYNFPEIWSEIWCSKRIWLNKKKKKNREKRKINYVRVCDWWLQSNWPWKGKCSIIQFWRQSATNVRVRATYFYCV